MEKGAIVVTLLVVPMLVLSAWALIGSQGAVEPQSSTILAEPPEYVSGYGFDPVTQTMEDTNGFRYSYQPDGIVQLDLPWGYTTHFSFGLTADYLGTPEKRTALDYTWAWGTTIGVALNETGNLTGYTYTFVATSQGGVLGWEIRLDFSPTSRMKVTHTLENDYANDLTNVKFWWLFDLTGTATPYTIETSAGIVEGPLYQTIPDSIHWVRLANQFQFDWSDALIDYENGHAYIGDGGVVGLVGLPILGISLELGDMAPGATITIDPFFSGVELTWDAGSDGLASTPANWSPVQAPDTGDNITFDATSVFNCDWNLEKTLGQFAITAGYTGTITQTADYGCVDWSIAEAGATYTGSSGHWLTCQGNLSRSVGTVTGLSFNVNMTGDDSTISASISFLSLYFYANVTSALDCEAQGDIKIGIGKTVNISAGKALSHVLNAGVTFTNLGTISDGGGYLQFYLIYDTTLTLGIVNSNVNFRGRNTMTGDNTLALGADTNIGSTLHIFSSHATRTITVIDDGYDINVDGEITLGTRGIINQGAGTWSCGSFVQSGADSIFNQATPFIISDDFTVSDGIFNAVGDMTVPGNWTTTTGDYANDDNVVTLTGASKTLAMHADDSFYNVTVSGSYTMDTDTTVRLRATISGTVDGTGDFIEPLPEFTSVGWPYGCPGELYEYIPTQTYWDTLAINDGPYWLFLVDGAITGVPNDNDTGVHLISLTLTWNDMTTYQNYTIIVCPELLTQAEVTMLGVGLSIVLGFGLICIGFFWKTPFLIAFAGFIWLFASVTVYKDISVGWTVISLGLGVIFLGVGGFLLVEESEY